MIGRGIATRIALAALASAALGVAIVAIGIAVVGAEVFRALMVEAGDSAEHAQAMYDESVTTVVVAAVLVAAAASIVLAVILARMLARPLAEVGAAARRIAEGDYAARVPRAGPEELASLADSFNQMAASLERQEAMRRDFIANAAHELRTPLTNLQGYLEALRDGVITADRATYESLWDEAERLVRLSHSLDALAEGDAASGPPRMEDVDLATAIRAALDLAQPSLDRAAPAAGRRRAGSPARAGQPGRARPGPLEPHLERGPLHAGRRHGDGPGGAPACRHPRLDLEHGRRHPAGRPRPRVRTVLPRREVARPGPWRGRHRARHRQAAGRGRRGPGRCRIRRRDRRGSGSACRPDQDRVRGSRSPPSRSGSRPARATGSGEAARRAGPPRRGS